MEFKKGQVALFIIIGIVILGLIGFMIFYLGDEKSDIKSDVSEKTINKEVIDNFVIQCIKQETIDALFYVGYSNKDSFNKYIDDNMKFCIDGFNEIKKTEGIDEVIEGKVSTDSIQSPDSITINLNYPIEFKKGSSVLKIESFDYRFDMKSKVTLSNDVKDKKLISPDGKYVLSIPDTLSAKDKDGNDIKEITLEIVDNQNQGVKTNIPIGKINYKLSPEGAEFSPPLSLKYKYEESEIEGIDEASLKISYYLDRPYSRTWVNYLQSSVDTSNNLIYARIEHFTEQAATTNSSSGDDSNSSNSTDDDSPNTCDGGEPSVYSEDSWCRTDCSTGSSCGSGMINCDCYGGCHTAGDDYEACKEVAEGSEGTCDSSGQSKSCGGGFLWKPESDSDGKLAVLLPSCYGTACTVSIGSETESLQSKKADVNGGRGHYRFSKPGSSYGNNVEVEVTCNGETDVYNVPSGSKRCE